MAGKNEKNRFARLSDWTIHMQVRQLGNTDLNFTTLGLGTWAIGGDGWMFGWGPQDDQEAIDTIVRAVDLGVNWIDTAAVYGAGHSEELVGQALRQIDLGERPSVATKFGREIQEDGTIRGVLTADSVRTECEASLRLLGIETISSARKFVRADLREADLTRAMLGNAKLSGAKYDDKTKWPEGFDPVAAGAVFEEISESSMLPSLPWVRWAF